MNKLISVTIPLKAINKKNNMIITGKRLIKNSKVIAYEAALRTAIYSALPAVYTPSQAPLLAIIKITYPNNIRRDIQNCLDIICDVMQGLVYEDDSQIYKIEAEKIIIKGKSEIFIEIYEI